MLTKIACLTYYILIGACLAEGVQSKTLADLFDDGRAMRLRLALIVLWFPMVLYLVGCHVVDRVKTADA